MSLGTVPQARVPFLMVSFVGAIAAGCRRRSRVSGGESAETIAELRHYTEPSQESWTGVGQTQLSVKLAELSHQLRALEAELTLKVSAVPAHRLFAPDRLASNEGLEVSLADAEKLRSIDKWYFAEAERQILEFDTWALLEFGRSLGEQPRMQADTRELLEKSIAVHESISRLLAFVQWSRPRLNEAGDVLLFGSHGEASRYTLLLEQIERRSAMLEVRQAEILSSRQRSAQQGLSYLGR